MELTPYRDQLTEHVAKAEDSDAARLAVYESLRQLIAWMQAGLAT